MKTRQPKAAPVARLGYEVKIVEMEFGQELRINAEIFHARGSYSSAMSIFKARALVEEGTDAKAATRTLVDYVMNTVGDTVKERIDEILEAIENQSSA